MNKSLGEIDINPRIAAAAKRGKFVFNLRRWWPEVNNRNVHLPIEL